MQDCLVKSYFVLVMDVAFSYIESLISHKANEYAYKIKLLIAMCVSGYHMRFILFLLYIAYINKEYYSRVCYC